MKPIDLPSPAFMARFKPKAATLGYWTRVRREMGGAR